MLEFVFSESSLDVSFHLFGCHHSCLPSVVPSTDAPNLFHLSLCALLGLKAHLAWALSLLLCDTPLAVFLCPAASSPSHHGFEELRPEGHHHCYF